MGQKLMEFIQQRKKQIIKHKKVRVDKLPGRCVFFQLSDYYNIRLYKKITNIRDGNLRKNIQNRFFSIAIVV